MTEELNQHNKTEYPPMHTAEHILNQTMVRMYRMSSLQNSHIVEEEEQVRLSARR
jgi:hypothetical protein